MTGCLARLSTKHATKGLFSSRMCGANVDFLEVPFFNVSLDIGQRKSLGSQVVGVRSTCNSWG